MAGTLVTVGESAAVVAPSGNYLPSAPADMPGWHRDFVDDFNAPLNAKVWGRYGAGGRTAGSLSTQDPNNIVTSNGQLVLTTHEVDGAWTSGGMSGAPGFSATQGKWAIKARFDRAYGIGYVFLLYPKGGGWPPEIDLAEGTAGGPTVMSTLHWGASNTTKSFFKSGLDMTQWHTYGVVMAGDTISYTVDGQVWSSFTNAGVPKIPMWFGLQAGAKDCAHSTGECVGPQTPATSGIDIDWIAHWAAS